MSQFSTENGYVTVPSEFIKNKIPGANPTFVKVYLYLAMLAAEKADCEYSEIAHCLGLLESDLMAAIKYWQNEGVLEQNGNGIVLCANPKNASDEENSAAETAESMQTAPHNAANIADKINSDPELSNMFMLAQEILGKTITERDMETLYWFCSDLGMSPEVVLMLLEYCVSKGKNRMSYIEKVAVSWNEMNLNTPDSAAEYIQNEEKKTGFLYSIRKIMGISDRSLSQIEEKYLSKWHDELDMSEEMIALAYEYCIIQTAKLSFPYMDKIITRWAADGITTIAAAEEDNKRFKNKNRRTETAFTDSTYDGDDLEMLSRNS